MSGYKTYIVGIGLVAFGIALIVQGEQQQGISRILEGLGFIFTRAAIAKVQ